MPPKKNRKNSKKKTSTKSNQNPSTSNNSSSTLNTNINFTNTHQNQNFPNLPIPPPNFLLYDDDDDDDDDDDPFSPFDDYGAYGYDDYDDFTDPSNFDYDDFDDYSNPFDPSYHNFIKEEGDEQKATVAAFEVVEDLDTYIKEGGNETNQALLKLPLDIFLEIISRLPIKPLAISRCVCKTWRMIVHHPRFIKMHHAKATQTPYNVSVLVHVSVSLLFELRYDAENKQVFSEIILLESEKDDGIEKGVIVNPQFMPPKLELKPSDLKFEVVGSCNGLLLLAEGAYYDPVYVCNPVIGEYMSLPASNKKMGFEILSGIGYDQVADEYKVVRLMISFMDSSDVPNCKTEAEVYTLGSGKWRKLGNFLYPLCKRSCQVLVKNSLHWMTHETCGSAIIIAFDVGKEEFQTMPSPPEFTHSVEDEDCELDLAELGGYLCLFAYWVDNRCEIWVMKEYGVNNSWTKQHVVSRKVCGLSEVRFRPVTMMRNGNILLVIDSQSLVCYDPKRKHFRKLKFQLPRRFDAITHVGSFISLRDIAAPTNSKQHVNTRGWYGVMKSISSQNPDFDIEGWKLNEQLRRLWWESH